MSDQYDEYDDDFDDDEQESGPKGLRAALKKAQRELAEAQKQNKTLTDQVATFTKQEKSRSLSELLSKAGVNARVAKFAEKDGVEPTEEAVKAWVEENRDVFNIGTNPTTNTPEGEGGEDADSGDTPPGDSDPYAGLPEEVQAALRAMQGSQAIESEGSSDSGEGAIETAIGAIGENAKSEADITAALAKLGAPIKGRA